MMEELIVKSNHTHAELTHYILNIEVRNMLERLAKNSYNKALDDVMMQARIQGYYTHEMVEKLIR